MEAWTYDAPVGKLSPIILYRGVPISNKLYILILEEKEFARVGGNELVRADVRIISATNKDLKKAVASGQFREDLYYRLNVVNIELPPLRERKEDILLLSGHFLRKFTQENQKELSGFSREVSNFLLKYQWPGNVRELENTIERAVILTNNCYIEVSDLSQQNLPLIHSTPPAGSLAVVEKNHILNILNETGGNYSEAARILGISRVTLYNKIRGYELDVKKINSN